MMAKIDNLNSGQLAPLLRRIEALERSLPLASSSVERGRMRFYEGSELLIQDSNLNVVGTATIRGTLRADGTIAFTGTLTQSGPSTFTGATNVSGDFTVTGPTKLNGVTDIGGNTSVTGDLNVKGPLNVTGATKLDGKTDIGGNTTVTGDLGVKGPLDVTGTMDIKGKSTLQNDLTVQGGGKISAGGVTIDPSRFNGGVVFDNGGYLAGTVNGAQLSYPSGGGVSVSSGQADIGVAGGGAVIAHGAGVAITGLPTTSEKPNVYIDNYGQLKRSTAN